MLDYFLVADRRYARFPALLAHTGLVHAFSTRPADVSARADTNAPRRAEARAQMARDLRLTPESLHHCAQVHQPRIERVRSDQPAAAHAGCDGLWTTDRGVGLMVFSADCPLILVHDPRRGAVGVCHSSWRCTIAGMTRLLVDALVREGGCNPPDLVAGIGPSAGPCCYEVKDDVRIAAGALPDADSFFPRVGDRMHFDLWSANAAQLQQAGVPASNIETAGVCTMCGGDAFYSFRREKAGCGHFGLLAALS